MARLEIELDDPCENEIAAVYLSERNLLAFLTKLYTPGSTCKILNNDIIVNGAPENGRFHFAIIAEKDDVHYASETRRGAPPGPMHPLTEELINVIKEYMVNHGASI